MKIQHQLAATALFALAACGGGGSSGDGKDGAGASDSSGAGLAKIQLRPGEWEIEHEVLSMEMPGMPKEAMAAVSKQKTTVKSCITPEQAAKPNADFFAAQNNGCSYKDFSMAGGKITGTLTCSGKDQPGTMTMKMDGEYGPDSYQMAVEMETDAAAGGMKIKSRGAGKRIGECPTSAAG